MFRINTCTYATLGNDAVEDKSDGVTSHLHIPGTTGREKKHRPAPLLNAHTTPRLFRISSERRAAYVLKVHFCGVKNKKHLGATFLYLNKGCLIRKTKRNDSAWSSYVFKCVEMSLYLQLYVCMYVKGDVCLWLMRKGVNKKLCSHE